MAEVDDDDLMYSTNRFAEEFSTAAPLKNAMSFEKKRSEQPIPMEFNLDENFDASALVAEPVKGVQGAFVIRKALSEEECEAMIAQVFEEDVPLGSVPVLWRKWSENSDHNHKKLGIRCTRSSQHSADVMWARVAPHVPKEIVSMDGRTHWKVSGLHERIRFVRYAPNQLFPPHKDGPLVKSDTERSQLTCLFYLSKSGGVLEKDKDFRGGELHFLTADDETRKTKRVATVRPERGMCVVFPHKTLHEGGSLKGAGFKYLIREDVMYTREQGGAPDEEEEEEQPSDQQEFH